MALFFFFLTFSSTSLLNISNGSYNLSYMIHMVVIWYLLHICISILKKGETRVGAKDFLTRFFSRERRVTSSRVFRDQNFKNPSGLLSDNIYIFWEIERVGRLEPLPKLCRIYGNKLKYRNAIDACRSSVFLYSIQNYIFLYYLFGVFFNYLTNRSFIIKCKSGKISEWRNKFSCPTLNVACLSTFVWYGKV